MSNIKVSVLIPSYNHGKYIKQCINSALNQTLKDIEIIIGDDCSTDNSRKVIEKFKDKRIKKVFFETNVGGTANLNRLIDLAHGKYIAVLNSDDYWERDKLQKQYDFMEKNKDYAACFTWARLVDENSNEIYSDNYRNVFLQKNKNQDEWFQYFLEYGNCLCHPSIMIRRNTYEEIGKYDIFLRQLPDFYLWIKIIKKYPIYLMEDTLTNFRILSNNWNTSSNSEENQSRMFQELYYISKHIFDNYNIEKYKHENEIITKFDQAKLLSKSQSFSKAGKLAAYEMISDLISNEENLNLLRQQREFSIQELYDLGTAYKNILNDEIEIKQNPILYSRGYKLLLKIYDSKLYKLLSKIRKIGK